MKRPIIGISTAFTGKYVTSKLIIRFLELLGVDVVKSTITNPEILEAGSTIASSEFCLPLRVYIGHIYYLIKHYPRINIIVTPIIKSEYSDSSTCAKYRDLDGVIIRSLGNMMGYRLMRSHIKDSKNLERLIGEEKTRNIVENVNDFPRIIAPEIESINKKHLRQVCIELYAEIFNLNKIKFLADIDFFKKNDLLSIKIEKAFAKAYTEIIEQQTNKHDELFSDKTKPRLAIVGRSYLIDDPALTADLKSYFIKKGVAVITAQDISFKELERGFYEVNGFYDSHKTSQAFINKVFNDVDGFIAIASFGCHPDAFQVEYLSKYINDQGKSCWTFKYDEQTGGIGFNTRYETILSFLENKRDERVKMTYNKKSLINNVIQSKDTKEVVNITNNTPPIFVWPYMGQGIDLILKEVWHELGLSNYIFPPKAVSEETIAKGNNHYTETCSPFSLYIGSLYETLEDLFGKLEDEAKNNMENVNPRRIIILMAKGKGPCTFGWYSIVGKSLLDERYSEVLEKYGHSLEMILLDNQGRNLVSFLEEIAKFANNDNLKQIVRTLEQIQHSKSVIKIARLEIKIIRLIKNIVWTGWEKLLAYEEIQNKALVVRAHELTKGSTTSVLNKWINELDKVHTSCSITAVKQHGLNELDALPQDKEVKPKVVIVGEIYGTLTSFANRGAIDNLLGHYGIEGVEGMRLSQFILGSFKGVKYGFFHSQPIVGSLVKLLESRGVYYPNKWVREPFAKPFLEHEVGGDGQPTVARARHYIESDGVEGILHIYPFKCMPEGIAKDALKEMCLIYGVKCLHLSYDREIEIERLKTEMDTFSVLLNQDVDNRKDDLVWKEREIYRRENIGRSIVKIYSQSKR